MPDRETLAQTLKDSGDRHGGIGYNLRYWGPVADDMLAAGWRSPARVITDPAELDKVPVYTIGTVGEGVAAQRWPDGWNVNGQHAHERSGSDELIEECGPVTIVYVPTDDPDCRHDSRHDSRSGADDGRWRCDQCGADCGPNTYLTTTEETKTNG